MKDHIAYMKPSTSVKEDSGLKISRVELKLQDVTKERPHRIFISGDVGKYGHCPAAVGYQNRKATAVW
ncbi:MAG: hypothetical protein R2860_13760 [Desulfobacterales bacterium]